MATFTVTTLDDELDDFDTLGTISIANFGGLNDISLREAIALAQDAAGDDDIDFDAALADGTLVLTLGELEVVGNGSLTINGDTSGDGKANITIDANNGSRVLSAYVAGETLSLESLTLTNGTYSFAGGAIYAGATMALEVLNSTISNSQSSNSGGAIFGGNVVIANSTIVGNEAGVRGGGVAVFPNGSATITNTTIHNNYALSIGGGVYGGTGSTLTINSSTITENESGANGGAIGAFAGSTLTIRNSVLADNTVPLGGEIIAELGGYSAITAGNSFFDDNLFNTGVDTDEGGNTFTVGADPGLDPLADNGGVVETQAIQDGSPLLEAGSETLLPTEVEAGLDVDGDGTVENTVIDVDGRGTGFDRDVDSDGIPPTPDIGAFELQLAADFVVTTNLDEAFDGGDLAAELADGDGLSLREALGLANLDPSTLDSITFDAAEFTGGLDSLIRLDAALGELVNAGAVSIDGSTGTDIVITGDTTGNDTLITGTYITDADASAGSLADNVRVLNITSGIAETTLNDLTITGGYTTDAGEAGRGGGIRTNAALTVTNSTVAGNVVAGEDSGGGGIGFAINDGDAGAITISDSEISGNRANSEGGGVRHSGDDIIVTNSTISDNIAQGFDAEGGGLRNSVGDIVVTDSVITGNAAIGEVGTNNSVDAEGGGLRNSSGDITITGSDISGNYASVTGQSISGQLEAEGGGVRTSGGNVTIVDSSVTGNKVISTGNTVGTDMDVEGGGIRNSGGDTFVINTTVASNVQTVSGNTVTGTTDVIGGGLSTSGGTIGLTNATVTSNYGAGVGGGIAVSGATGEGVEQLLDAVLQYLPDRTSTETKGEEVE
ncbi:MAG: right-handed parallel beta-helix repeat-containing protein, partial [Pseudomonadota bacterium]